MNSSLGAVVKRLLAAAATCMAVAAPQANAALILTLDDLSTAGVDVTVADGAINDLLGPGAVAYVGAAGSWILNSTAGIGSGISEIFGIDLNSLSVSSAAGGTLRIALTETDLWLGGLSNLSTLIGGTTQGTVSYSAYLDAANAAFGHGTLLTSGTGTGAFSAADTTSVSVSAPFSLTLSVDITHSGMRTTSFDFASQVPEPATLTLLSMALIPAVAVVRRRQAAIA